MAITRYPTYVVDEIVEQSWQDDPLAWVAFDEGDYGPEFSTHHAEKWRGATAESFKKQSRDFFLEQGDESLFESGGHLSFRRHTVKAINRYSRPPMDLSDFFPDPTGLQRADERDTGVSLGCM